MNASFAKLFVTSLALSLFCSVSVAQDNYAEQRKELLSMLGTIESAINKSAMDQVEPFLTDNTIVIFQDATTAVGSTEVNNYFEKVLGAGDSLLTDMTLKATVGGPAQFYQENVAVAYGYIDAEYFFRVGKPLKLRTYWTTTVVKNVDESDNTSGSDWSIASLHFSNNLFDNPILNASKRLVYIAGAVGAVVGLALMWLLLRLFRRKTAA